jgi:PTS system nitrogen regulatory IIA component
MRITEFFSPERIFLDVWVRSKPQLLAEVARNFARLGPLTDAEMIETALLSREHLGSTGLGNGFALPHARIEALPVYQGMFMRLQKPIEFESIDGKPVSMVFVLLIPGTEAASHVSALAAISRLFRNAAVVDDLRRTSSIQAAWNIFIQ